MRLTCENWRDAPPEDVVALYALEARRWSSELEWDTASNWEEVERGRQAGLVPGVLVRDVSDPADPVVAWSYYLIHHRALQVGGFVASSEAASQMMLDAIFTEANLASVDTVSFFAFADTPELAPALRQRGLSVDRYWYLKRATEQAVQQALPQARRWRPDDTRATAELLRRAYESPNEARPFAPRGTPDEWLDYVTQLIAGSGCGTVMTDACVAVPVGPDRLSAVAIVTRIAQGTGHIAQLAVDPEFQGQGLGASLVEAACGSAARAGCARVTLLVGGRNRRARQLYEGARFEAGPSFLAAGSLQPRRSTSVAPGASVITLR